MIKKAESSGKCGYLVVEIASGIPQQSLLRPLFAINNFGIKNTFSKFVDGTEFGWDSQIEGCK